MKKCFSVLVSLAPWSSLLALALFSSMALADVPYPPNCSVSPCDAFHGAVLCPDAPSPIPATVVTLTIRNQAGNPLPNHVVQVTFGAGPLCICPDMMFSATTNQQGVAILTLSGGGCILNTDLACVFRAAGVVIRDFTNLKSPDWDGAAGNCAVNLADLVHFSQGTDLCFDFNNTGTEDIGDLVIFVSGYSPSRHCP